MVDKTKQLESIFKAREHVYHCNLCDSRGLNTVSSLNFKVVTFNYVAAFFCLFLVGCTTHQKYQIIEYPGWCQKGVLYYNGETKQSVRCGYRIEENK